MNARLGLGVLVSGVIGVLLIVAALGPVYWMMATSLKTDNQIFSTPPVWVFHPTFEHYRHVLADLGMASALVHSATVGIATTVLAIILGVPAGYAIARFRFRGRRDVWFWFISNYMMIPVILIIPYFLIAKQLHAINSPLMLILAYQTFAIPLVVWLTADQFAAIPKALDEAAMLDGAGEFAIFLRIMVPLAIPGIAVAGILSLIFSWNELLYATILTPNDESRTAPVTALSFLGGYEIPWGDLMAAGTLIVLPVIVFAVLVSRYLVRGLTLGAVK
jgi:multiple sugar transport system permease protein